MVHTDCPWPVKFSVVCVYVHVGVSVHMRDWKIKFEIENWIKTMIYSSIVIE